MTLYAGLGASHALLWPILAGALGGYGQCPWKFEADYHLQIHRLLRNRQAHLLQKLWATIAAPETSLQVQDP